MNRTVSEVASQAGVSSHAVRYYERVGLLAPPGRSESGYRLYDDAAIERLRLISGARRLGLPIASVRDLLEVMDRGLCPCGHAEALVRQRIAEIDAELRRLAALRQELTRLIDRLPACVDPERDGWPCAEEFIRMSGAKGGDGDEGVPMPTVP